MALSTDKILTVPYTDSPRPSSKSLAISNLSGFTANFLAPDPFWTLEDTLINMEITYTSWAPVGSRRWRINPAGYPEIRRTHTKLPFILYNFTKRGFLRKYEYKWRLSLSHHHIDEIFKLNSSIAVEVNVLEK